MEEHWLHGRLTIVAVTEVLLERIGAGASGVHTRSEVGIVVGCVVRVCHDVGPLTTALSVKLLVRWRVGSVLQCTTADTFRDLLAGERSNESGGYPLPYEEARDGAHVAAPHLCTRESRSIDHADIDGDALGRLEGRRGAANPMPFGRRTIISALERCQELPPQRTRNMVVSSNSYPKTAWRPP